TCRQCPPWVTSFSLLCPTIYQEQMEHAKRTQLLTSTASRAPSAREDQRTRNRVPAEILSDLLDARKQVATRDELDALARQYDVDVDKLESLARTVSSLSVAPSVGDGGGR